MEKNDAIMLSDCRRILKTQHNKLVQMRQLLAQLRDAGVWTINGLEVDCFDPNAVSGVKLKAAIEAWVGPKDA